MLYHQPCGLQAAAICEDILALRDNEDINCMEVCGGKGGLDIQNKIILKPLDAFTCLYRYVIEWPGLKRPAMII